MTHQFRTHDCTKKVMLFVLLFSISILIVLVCIIQMLHTKTKHHWWTQSINFTHEWPRDGRMSNPRVWITFQLQAWVHRSIALYFILNEQQQKKKSLTRWWRIQHSTSLRFFNNNRNWLKWEKKIIEAFDKFVNRLFLFGCYQKCSSTVIALAYIIFIAHSLVSRSVIHSYNVCFAADT